MGTLRFTLGLILGIGLTYTLQRWDRGRLAPEQQAAAWNGASWGVALYAFGPLSMVGWVWVTRQRFGAWRDRDGVAVAIVKSAVVLLAGLAAAALLVLEIEAADAVVGAIVGRR